MRITLNFKSVTETVETTRDLTDKEIRDLESGRISVYELDCVDWDTEDRIDSDLTSTEVG